MHEHKLTLMERAICRIGYYESCQHRIIGDSIYFRGIHAWHRTWRVSLR